MAQFVHDQSDGEAPDANLGSDIEELGHHAPGVVLVAQQAAEGGCQGSPTGSVLTLRHAHEEHDEHDDQQDGAQEGVGAADAVERDVLQDEVLADEYAHNRAYGVKALGDVQTARSGLGAAHGHDVRVGRGLQHRAACRHDVDGHQVEQVALRPGGGQEEDGTGGIHQQSQNDATLVAVAAYEQGGRQGQTEVGSVEGHLDETGLRVAHLHNLAEGGQQRVGHVVGQAPQGKEAGDQHKG